MQEVLQQINTVPEVIGTLLCDGSGRVLAQTFPPLFDAAIMEQAAATLATGPLALRNGAGANGFLDLRYNDGRIVARQLEGALLLVLCTKAVNLQMLTISLNVARNKLEPLIAPIPTEAQPPATAAHQPPPTTGKGFVLMAGRLEKSAPSQGFNELGMVGVNYTTAKRISDRYETGPFKKITLTNPAGGQSGSFPVMVITDEENRYDGRIILSPAIEKKLKVQPDAEIIAEL